MKISYKNISYLLALSDADIESCEHDKLLSLWISNPYGEIEK